MSNRPEKIEFRVLDISSEYQQYATAALQALIQKMPFLDTKGEMGVKTTEEEAKKIKIDVCRAAHYYALLMIETKIESFEHFQNTGRRI